MNLVGILSLSTGTSADAAVLQVHQGSEFETAGRQGRRDGRNQWERWNKALTGLWIFMTKW